MPWVKLDDRFPSHRKVALLSDRAFRLHVSAICWCAENLTDGHISDRELTLVAHVRGTKATAKQLEEAGVWDRVDGGWVIHDYLDYNPSREQVVAERKKNAARQEAFRRRKNGKPTPPPNDSSNGASNGVTRHGKTHDGDTNEARRRHDGDTTATWNEAPREDEPQVSGIRHGVTNGAPTRPDPTRTPDMADVGGKSARSDAPEAWPEGPPAPIDTDGFTVTDSMRRWANDVHPHVDLQHSTDQFLAHYRSTGTRRKNWPEAWRKWIAEDAHRGNRPTQGAFLVPLPGGNTHTPSRPSVTDQRVRDGLALAERLRLREEAQRQETS